MSNAEMEKQAAGLKQMRVGMNKGLLEAEQKFQRTGIEYFPTILPPPPPPY